MRIMAIGLAAMLVSALPPAASAQSRPDTQKMSCGEARSLVARYGAIVMTTGPGTYERIVASERFCLLGESARPALAISRDRGQCVVGYYCGQASDFSVD